MAKLYFKYGAMGSSKSAQALITKFNYEELGMTVWLIKPSIDTRDGADLIHSRIGLEAHAQIITPEQSIVEAYRKPRSRPSVPADGKRQSMRVSTRAAGSLPRATRFSWEETTAMWPCATSAGNGKSASRTRSNKGKAGILEQYHA